MPSGEDLESDAGALTKKDEGAPGPSSRNPWQSKGPSTVQEKNSAQPREANSLLRLATAAQQHPIQPKILDERQEAFLEWLLLPEEMRTPPTMAAYGEVHDLSYATLKRWKQTPHFRAAYEKRVKESIATPERVEEATRLAYQRGIVDGDIKWATLWAQMAGLTKQEPGIAKSGAEAIAELTDEELDALLHDSAQAEAKRRQTS